MNRDEKMRILEGAFLHLRSKGVIKTYQDFASMLGVTKNSLSAAKNGNETYLTDNLISKITSLMRELEDTYPSIQGPRAESPETLLVIPTSAMAGTLVDFADSVSAHDCERMLSPIKGADYAMKVSGDSMSPEYPSGSQILIKRVNEQAFIEWGKVYVLDTENGAIIKQIRKTDRPDVVECVSLNPAYQPFSIETTYIKGWYRVLMVLSLK